MGVQSKWPFMLQSAALGTEIQLLQGKNVEAAQ